MAADRRFHLLERGRLARTDRAGDEAVIAQRIGALLECGLSLQQCVEFLLELLLVEQLAAGDAVDLRAQLGDAVFVGELHLRLAGDEAGEHVVVEGEIGSGHDRPDAHDHQRADHDPEQHGTDAHLAAAMHQHVVAGRAMDVARDSGGRTGPGGGARGVTGGLRVRRGRMRHRLIPRRHEAGRRRYQQGRYQPVMVKKAQTARIGVRLQPVVTRTCHRSLAAARTSSAWPSTRTFGQMRAIRPWPSIRKVLRMTPMNLRPYIDFSPQAP